MNRGLVALTIMPLIALSAIVIGSSLPRTFDVCEYLVDEGREIEYSVLEPEKNLEINLVNSDLEACFSTPYLSKSFVGFKEALAFKESRGDYFVVNTLGYLGKYQFNKNTLKLVGIYNPDEFLKSPKLQEKAFIANTARNKWILRRDINRFVGKRIDGVLVTESGILAAAHLAGPGSVKKYLRSYGAIGFTDAYGTSIRYYMKRFSGYDTSFIHGDRKAKASMM
jgi:hypothetical protein